MTTVLVVDDEPAVLDTLTACCDNAGYEPIASLDGKDALRLFFQHHPDLVIADIMMPGLNGFELCKRIREVSEVPIIVLSALGAEREKVQGLQAGADDYIVKPVGMAELVARIEDDRVNMLPVDIASSDVREQLRLGHPADHLLPARVLRWIRQRGLFGTAGR